MADRAQPVGLIGLGLLGSALAERLLAGGREVIGFDLQPERQAALARAGGESADSAGEVAARCRQIVLCLPDSQEVAAVVEQLRDQWRRGQPPEGIALLDTTTGDPAATAGLGAALAAERIAYLDATVAGSSQQARRGEILLLVGGRADDLQACRPVLELFTDRIFHVGPWGSGARMKLVFNLVLGLNRAALAEGLSLASACGLDLPVVLDVLRAGPARSAVMESKGDKMLSGDFTPHARLAQHLKDVRLIQQLAHGAGARVPLTDVHRELLERAVELGLGEADNSAVIRAWRS
ncbi:MAG: NAD(P)-dependent oxidoreductase [Pirellulaceae bacterium]|nr:NAD(P)-dependent oxidoreductase [Pirellulaceae bacterium]